MVRLWGEFDNYPSQDERTQKITTKKKHHRPFLSNHIIMRNSEIVRVGNLEVFGDLTAVVVTPTEFWFKEGKTFISSRYTFQGGMQETNVEKRCRVHFHIVWLSSDDTFGYKKHGFRAGHTINIG